MFNFIRKLFKALNSSGKSWQLSAAIVLAMFAGFLPTNTLILFDILFIALILNVNFGLFLLFSVIFSGIGYLFDPLFESIGYAILTSESLNGLFTSLYNSVIFRWTSFNYTLVTGSLIVSSVLALPMLLVLNRLVRIYRVQIGEKLNEWKLTRWMKLFNEEAKSSSLFRWWGLGVFGGLAGFIIVIMLFVFDPLAKIALEKTLSYALKTEVDIKSFRSSLSDLEIEIKGIEVSDKDKLTHNVVQIDTLSFDLGFSALMEKKTMIEHLNLQALAFDRQREVPAEAYCSNSSKEEEEADEKKGSTDSASIPAFSLPSVDDILAKEELKSVQEAQELKADIQATREKWEKRSAELKNTDDVDVIKKDAKALQESLKNADLTKIASAKQDIDALQSKIKALKEKYTKLQAEFDADQKRLQKRIAALKDLPSKDIARLKEKYALNAGGGANMIGTLIDQEVGEYIKTALKYYAMIKPYIRDGKTQKVKEATPPRGQGRWIKYANLSTTPELLIKEAKINVKLAQDEIDVKVTDFSSNQKLYQKPMVLHADAKGSTYESFQADMVDDRRMEEAKTSFDLKANGFKTPSVEMTPLLMQDITSDINVKGMIIDKNIQAKSDVRVEKVKLLMPSQKLVNDMLAGISTFNVLVAVNGELEKPSISVKTDLDKQLSKGLASVASNAGKKFEDELRAGVMDKAGASSKGIDLDLGDTGALLNSKQDALSGINTDFTASKSNPLKGILPF
jgi:uncharacterized protein (TIGR03545 family)/uncharacterized protein (TIGR03546 family)